MEARVPSGLSLGRLPDTGLVQQRRDKEGPTYVTRPYLHTFDLNADYLLQPILPSAYLCTCQTAALYLLVGSVPPKNLVCIVRWHQHIQTLHLDVMLFIFT